MGKQFDVVYDDFTGGHYMGPTQANQPRNTWTGPNVICTADQGFLMPDGGLTKMTSEIVSAGTSEAISQPIAFRDPANPVTSNASIFFTRRGSTTIYRVVMETNTITPLATTANNTTPLAATSVLGNRVAFQRETSSSVTMYLCTYGGTVTTVTVPVDFTLGTWWWGNFAFGATLGSNRLYFSAAGDPTSWPANNYFDVGESGYSIISVVPTGDVLYVGTSAGWWAISGVPGQTASLRKLATPGIGGLPQAGAFYPQHACGASLINQGVLFRSPRGALVNVLSGSTVRAFAHSPGLPGSNDAAVDMVTSAGDLTCVLDTTYSADRTYNAARLFLWSDLHRRWRVKSLPTAAQVSAALGVRYWTVEDRDALGTNLYLIGAETNGVNNVDLVGWYAPKEPVDPQTDANGYYDTATVTLSEYSQPTPFAVKEMIVELDFGQPATQGAQRTVKASVVTQGVTDLDQTFAVDTGDLAVPFSSSQFAKSWQNANNTRRGHRQTIRFAPTDGAAATLTAAPVIEMTGVKVRRVILRCETV